MSTTTAPRGSEHFDPLAHGADDEAIPATSTSTTTPKASTAPQRVSTRPQVTTQPTKPAAPTATGSPDSGGAPTEQIEPVTGQAATSERDPQWYARRRNRLKWAAIIAVLVVGWLALNQPWKNITTPGSDTSITTLTSDATDQVTQDLVYAEQYLAANGTLSGIAIDGAQLAVRDQTMYAVRTINGVCTVYGILNGQRLQPAPDATGAACSGQIITVQAALDAAANQAQATSQDAATTTLDRAERAALQYAARNYVNGAPSMTGLPVTVEGAVVLENTGEYVQLRVSYPEACLQAYVTAAGEIGDTNSCS